MLTANGKQISTDEKFDSDAADVRLTNYVFVRLVAKRRTFTNVDFKYSFFDTCYLRECTFDSCDFTGSRFVNSNLHGSKFSGCKFEYSYFEKTHIDPLVLDTECPGLENLKSRFARTLRMNFQQLGDAGAVNKAMKVEMNATALHLRKAAWSNESYYRRHYRGWGRARAFGEWLKFWALDFIWGNGENLFRLVVFVLIVLSAMAAGDLFLFQPAPITLNSFRVAWAKALEIFFGTISPPNYWPGYLAFVTFLRLIIVALFLSIIIRKVSRR